MVHVRALKNGLCFSDKPTNAHYKYFQTRIIVLHQNVSVIPLTVNRVSYYKNTIISNCILLIRHPVDGRRSNQPKHVNEENNLWLNIFINVSRLVCHIIIEYIRHVGSRDICTVNTARQKERWQFLVVHCFSVQQLWRNALHAKWSTDILVVPLCACLCNYFPERWIGRGGQT